MSQALYRKWRPQTWDEVVGQPHVIQTLRNAVKGERVAHAYLFAGPRGTGKTSTARLLAKAVNCLADDPADRPCNQCAACVAVNEGRFLDLIEIDAASNTSVEDVRDLRDKINFAPNEGRAKVYIVDEVHMLSTAAFNALLKTLEEPPDHAIFVLATTEVHKIPATVLSRCQRHEFRRLPVKVIADYLSEQVAKESIDAEPQALEAIARQATGSFRDAISLLDQLASTGDAVTLETVHTVLGTAASQAVRGLVSAWIESRAGEGLTLINNALDGGADARQLARQTVDRLRNLLMVKMGNDELLQVSAETRHELEADATRVTVPRLLVALEAFSAAAREGRSNWQPALPLELAFLESLASPSAGAEAPQTSGASDATSEEQSESKAAGTSPIESPPAPPSSAPPRQVKETTSGQKEAASNDSPQAMGPLTFKAVEAKWREVLAAIYDRDPRAQALLNSGEPLGLDHDRLVVGFASDLLREKMEKGDTLEKVSSALEQVLGQPVGVMCVLSDQWVGGEPDPGGPVVENGGMVDTAVRELGAEVSELEPGSDAPAGGPSQGSAS
jgi:DNA polymerase-3 subunit gamma/tau